MKNEATVTVTQTYQAPVDRVWQAITNAEQMRRWYFLNIIDFEPETGFGTTFDEKYDDGSTRRHIWKVVDVIPEKMISYEWRTGNDADNSLVTFVLAAEGNITSICVIHERIDRFTDPDITLENLQKGWGYFIDTTLKNFVEQTSEQLL